MKQIPTNLQDEQFILGSIFNDEPAVYPAVTAVLKAEDFADPVHGYIYREISARVVAGLRARSLLEEAACGRSAPDIEQRLEEVGGSMYLLRCAEAARERHGESVGAAIQAVAAARRGRLAIDACEQINIAANTIMSAGFSGGITVDDLGNLDRLKGCLISVASRYPAVEIVDGNVVDMRHPDDLQVAPADQYGDPMVMILALTRTEVESLAGNHEYAAKRFRPRKGLQQSDRDTELVGYHTERGRVFRSALDQWIAQREAEDDAAAQQVLDGADQDHQYPAAQDGVLEPDPLFFGDAPTAAAALN